MPVSLRKRLTCHYCGKRLNTARKESNRVHCDACSADNYFDEKNNIVDVPATVAARLQNGPQAEIESESDVFCKTCLTNQNFYIRALADYLPEEDDPRYQELARLQPQFEHDLALRYPQCCAQCEPRVEARIRQANYAAKSDHLRRLMHRKHGRRKTPELQLRSLFISLAGAGQVFSLIIQLLWHLGSSQNDDTARISASRLSCLQSWPPHAQCSKYIEAWAPYSLVIALLCVWWNPKWQHRLYGKEGRLIGLRNYYLAQCFLLALRFTAWVALTEFPSLQLHSSIVHTVCLGAFSMIGIYSWFALVHIDTTPLVDWHKVQPPLTDAEQFRPPDISAYQARPNKYFSVDNLATSSAVAYEPWRPPTPPVTEDDSMDWAPSARPFGPRPRIPPPKYDQPSPFHGTLPAAPMRGTLNPNRSTQEPSKKALGLPPGFFGLSKSSRSEQGNGFQQDTETIFAPAKFFGHDRQSDTGLEGIFDKMFSVRDTTEPRETAQQQSQLHATLNSSWGEHAHQLNNPDTGYGRRTAGPPSLRLVVCCSFIVALAVIASSLCSLEMAYGNTTAAPSSILPYTAVVPLLHAVEDYLSDAELPFVSFLVLCIEVVSLSSAHVAIPESGSDYVPVWNKLVIGLVCFLLLQEIYRFCHLQTTPVSDRAIAHMAESMRRAEQEDDTLYANGISGNYVSDTSTTSDRLITAQQQYSQQSPFAGLNSSVRRRDSDESISSVSSIQTTSTAPGWKTPKQESRSYDWQNNGSSSRQSKKQSVGIARGLDGLSLGNQFSGVGVAGPRNGTPRRSNRQ